MDHAYFMGLALQEAEAALGENEFPVGAVLVADGMVLASGRRCNSRDASANELDHAEMVVLRELLGRQPLVDRSRVVAYSTMEPCLMCFSTMLLNGIRTFVYAYEDAMGGGTSLPLERLAPLYREMAPEVRVVPHLLRARSLDLFKRFFAGAESCYWQDSLLARYTLAQP